MGALLFLASTCYAGGSTTVVAPATNLTVGGSLILAFLLDRKRSR